MLLSLSCLFLFDSFFRRFVVYTPIVYALTVDEIPITADRIREGKRKMEKNFLPPVSPSLFLFSIHCIARFSAKERKEKERKRAKEIHEVNKVTRNPFTQTHTKGGEEKRNL